MRFFTSADLMRAALTMLAHADLANKQLGGTMNGIKRRARNRAIVEFGLQLDPPPPDLSITTMRAVLRRFFGRAVSNDDLQRYFATPGRKADDRVNLARLDAWLAEHGPRLREEGLRLLGDLDAEWKDFTREASYEAGRLRREAKKEYVDPDAGADAVD